MSSLHPQSPHWQTAASGLQQHFFATAGLDEQQLDCFLAKLLQQDDSSPDASASAETVAPQVQLDPELKANGCEPIAAVANTISVVSNVRRIFRLVFMILLPAQMIVGRSDEVKANSFFNNQLYDQNPRRASSFLGCWSCSRESIRAKKTAQQSNRVALKTWDGGFSPQCFNFATFPPQKTSGKTTFWPRHSICVLVFAEDCPPLHNKQFNLDFP